ncbi:hypothetical protein HanRHA438_Chr14g0643131 [Helianthus annuus]|nr:hypothetical protein HanIR_Chr14g0686111 [Helianthus annuus]KAJ0852738.1 hypothetical protein HanRHA438_Chr14g0643131 [Helianthus annuus]
MRKHKSNNQKRMKNTKGWAYKICMFQLKFQHLLKFFDNMIHSWTLHKLLIQAFISYVCEEFQRLWVHLFP